jgi:HEAT repeat protein
MRLKVIISVLLVTAAVVFLIVMGHSGRNEISLSPDSSAIVVVTTNDAPPNSEVALGRSDAAPANPSSSFSAQQSHDEYVSSRVAELMDFAMTDDPQSLRSILSELNNPEIEIRQAAVIAAVQFKSADAIPALQDAYTRTDELEEKVSIRKAIAFLQPAPAAETVTLAK